MINNINNFINSIPNVYKDIDIISDDRNKNYMKTLIIRLESICK